VSRRSDKAERGMDEVVRSLAALLIQAVPLAELLDSPKASHEQRAALVEQVGPMRYFVVTNSFYNMSSWRAWLKAHGDDEDA